MVSFPHFAPIFTNRDDARIFGHVSLKNHRRMEICMIKRFLLFAQEVFTILPLLQSQMSRRQIPKGHVLCGIKTGYEHLRMIRVDPQRRIILLKNFSAFPVKTDGWKLTSERKEVDLSGHEIASGKMMAVPFSVDTTSPKVFLIAPDGKAKQLGTSTRSSSWAILGVCHTALFLPVGFSKYEERKRRLRLREKKAHNKEHARSLTPTG